MPIKTITYGHAGTQVYEHLTEQAALDFLWLEMTNAGIDDPGIRADFDKNPTLLCDTMLDFLAFVTTTEDEERIAHAAIDAHIASGRWP